MLQDAAGPANDFPQRRSRKFSDQVINQWLYLLESSFPCGYLVAYVYGERGFRRKNLLRVRSEWIRYIIAGAYDACMYVHVVDQTTTVQLVSSQ